MKIYIVLFFCIIGCVSCTVVTETTLISKENSNGYYYLPILVNGQKLTFLLDTGAQYTVIDYAVAKKLGIVPIDSSFHTIHTITYSHQDSVYWGFADLQIGDIKIKNKITLDKYKSSIWRDVADYKDFDGILGVDIIQEFNWLFDLKNKMVCLSNKVIDNPLILEKPALSLDIVENETGVTYVNLLLNNTVKQQFLFDTGHDNGIQIGDYKLDGAFCFSDTLFNILAKRFPNNLTIKVTDTSSVLLMEKLQVNEMKFLYISAAYNSRLLHPNAITAQLLHQFQFMYYDKINKKINFYHPQPDSNVKSREEIQLLQMKVSDVLDSKGGETTSSWNDIFTKHDSVSVVKPVKKE